MGVLPIGLQEEVPTKVKSMKHLSELLPVDVPFIRKHMAVGTEIVMEMNGQQSMAELLQHLETGSLDVLMAGIVTEPDGITAEFRQTALQHLVIVLFLTVL